MPVFASSCWEKLAKTRFYNWLAWTLSYASILPTLVEKPHKLWMTCIYGALRYSPSPSRWFRHFRAAHQSLTSKVRKLVVTDGAALVVAQAAGETLLTSRSRELVVIGGEISGPSETSGAEPFSSADPEPSSRPGR